MNNHYESLNGEDNQKATCPRWLAISCSLISFVLAGSVSYILTRSHYVDGTLYDSDKAFAQAPVFQSKMLFSIPYVGLNEPFMATVDNNQGLMSLSYYNGADVYYYNTTTNSTQFSLLPVYDQQKCFGVNTQNNQVVPLPNLFPDMSLFAKSKDQTSVTVPLTEAGVSVSNFTTKCDVWTYTYGNFTKTPSGNANATLPDTQGYSGTYTFYRDYSTGRPVAFHMEGHNVINGGSHVDEYWLYYMSYNTITTFDSSLFQPPQGLACTVVSVPVGPTEDVSRTDSGSPDYHFVRSDPATDLNMMMPQHHTLRNDKFSNWAQKYSKMFSSEEEKRVRMNVFHSNLRFINAGNRKNRKYSLKANHMADWTMTEKRMLSGRKQAGDSKSIQHVNLMATGVAAPDYNSYCGQYVSSNKTLPAMVDWVNGTRVNAPKDQGTCGSCWTYGVTGAIEGAWAKKTGKLVNLSEQNVMDCTWAANNNACAGGLDYPAYGWLLENNNGQLAGVDQYGKDLNQNGFCHFDVMGGLTFNPVTQKNVTGAATFMNCTHISEYWKNNTFTPVTDQAATDLLTDALAFEGPLSVSMDAASSADFYYYNKGVYDNPACKTATNDMDHIVLAVGYITLKDKSRATTIRNSWSTHWGDGGYAQIAQTGNICGIATAPTFVTA